MPATSGKTAKFLSTPSARRATPEALLQLCRVPDFYPRPPRGGRRAVDAVVHLLVIISIHALREEGDAGPVVLHHASVISIHALREEGDMLEMYRLATRLISIHALREEGDGASVGDIIKRA